MEPDLSLEGKVAIVTGAARGIGEEIARTFAAHGASIVVVDSLEKEGAETVRELGAGATFLACDVSDPDAVCSMVEAVVERHGRLDILVSAAGAGPSAGSAAGSAAEERATSDAYPDELFARAIAVGANGAFYCAKYGAQRMIVQGAGSIITIVAAPGGTVGQAAAAAAAVRLTEAMALELGARGLRVNAVSAGASCTPVDVAHAALFLASDMSSRVNGHTLAVDGGESR
jgi:3-oxoacyl-[acyl-carrier protein] reductase